MEENDLINKYIESNFFGKLIGMHFNPDDFRMEKETFEYYLTITKDHLATPNAAGQERTPDPAAED